MAAAVCAQPAQETPSLALFYGPSPPIHDLQAFDRVVLEPDHTADPAALPQRHTAWYAYVSVVETQASRAYAAELQPAWRLGENAAWRSIVIDPAAAGWADFFVERVLAPLWQRGWRRFFLDTLDSHRLFAAPPEVQAARQTALESLLRRLPTRFPGIRLLLNRGFELLPAASDHVDGVAAESLVGGFDATRGAYREVAADDRRWLLEQLQRARGNRNLPVYAIDYAPAHDRAATREVARRVRALGVMPYVADGLLSTLGVGTLEVVPRRVALVADRSPGADWMDTPAFRLLAMPLNYLGYIVEPLDLREPLPPRLTDGRYAALVLWADGSAVVPRLAETLMRLHGQGLRLVLMNGLPPPGGNAATDNALLAALGLERSAMAAGDTRILQRHAALGFEAQLPATLRAQQGVRIKPDAGGESWLRLEGGGRTVDAAGIAPWGGFALSPFLLQGPRLGNGARWLIDPIGFLHAALGSPAHPVPDVTTEGGRRLLMVHIDGDGFASRAEAPGTPWAAELLLRDVLQRRRVPVTMSVIQGEIAENGLYPALSPQLEEVARRIFALPHVEPASHSFSHPFDWRAAERGGPASGSPVALPVPGYRFDLAAETAGSARYMDSRLLPPGKRTRVFLWTGDCTPSAAAVAATATAGLLNMNGGDTTITRAEPTLTAVGGLGLQRGEHLQVFAPNQNENVYTNLWTGPYYGYRRAIETFELTESPRRLKPINIYFHTYSTSKPAGLNALNEVFDFALSQPTTAVFASDYIRKVIDFHQMALARAIGGRDDETRRWVVRGGGELRTLRLPAESALSLRASRGVAGLSPVRDGVRYAHLADAAAELAPGIDATPPAQVAETGGWIGGLRRSADGGIAGFTLHAYRDPSLRLAHAAGCRVAVNGKNLSPRAVPGSAVMQHYELPIFEPATTAARFVVDIHCR